MDGIAIPAASTVWMAGTGTLRNYNYYANCEPLVSGVYQALGTGSDLSYNIGWLETDVGRWGPEFEVVPLGFLGPLGKAGHQITPTAIPFLDRYEMEHWYEDHWGPTGNLLRHVGSRYVVVRHKDPCVVSLGANNGWLMLVCRDMVRQDVASYQNYPQAVTALGYPFALHSFPDNPGVAWTPDLSVTPPNVSEKCEYLADIVAFWSETEDFDAVVGPFWIRPSLVTAAAPDEDYDEIVADMLPGFRAAWRPRYWYGVPGAVVVGPAQNEQEDTLYVYFVKDQCFHNHADNPGSVGSDANVDLANSTASESRYFHATFGPARIVLRKILISDIRLAVSRAIALTGPLPAPETWDELDDSLPALLPGTEYRVTVYDARSVDRGVDISNLFSDNEGNVGLAGPMPALDSSGNLLLFLVVAKDMVTESGTPRSPRSYNPNGIWAAFDYYVGASGEVRGATLALGDQSQVVEATSSDLSSPTINANPLRNYYDPDPVLVPPAGSPGSGTWYLYTGHGADKSTVWCFSGAETEIPTS